MGLHSWVGLPQCLASLPRHLHTCRCRGESSTRPALPTPPLLRLLLPALQEERTQGRNRERAMTLLRAKLFELELEKQRR